MNHLFLATIILFWSQLSVAAPLTVTTSSKNLIADLLAGFQDASTSTTSPVVAATLISQVVPISTTPTIPLSLPTSIPIYSDSDVVPADSNTAYSTDNLSAILSQIAAAGTASTTSVPLATGTSSATSSATSTGTSTSSATSSTSGSLSGILSVFLSVIEYLVKKLGSSGTISSLVEDAVDLLDGLSSSTTAAAATASAA